MPINMLLTKRQSEQSPANWPMGRQPTEGTTAPLEAQSQKHLLLLSILMENLYKKSLSELSFPLQTSGKNAFQKLALAYFLLVKTIQKLESGSLFFCGGFLHTKRFATIFCAFLPLRYQFTRKNTQSQPPGNQHKGSRGGGQHLREKN